MKKRIALALVLALSLISVFALCVSADTCAHVNTGIEGDDYDTGHYTACYDCYERLSEVTAHSWDSYEQYDSTNHWLECSVCLLRKKELHSVGEPVVTKEPTCIEDGIGVYYCADCGEYLDTAVIDLDRDAHEYEYVYLDSTEHVFSCIYCQESDTPEPHSFSNYTEYNYHVTGCQDCGYETSRHLIEVGEPVIIKPPTCVEAGVGVYTCVVCGESDTAEIDFNRDAHEYKYVYLDSTEHVLSCVYCDEGYRPEAHTWNAGVVTKQPTATENGVRTFTCTACNGTKTETIDYIDLDELLNNMTQEEATDLYKKIFDKYQTALVKDDDVGYLYGRYFAGVVFPDLNKNGVKSEYYSLYGDLYTIIANECAENTIAFQLGYNDAMSSVIDKNPIQGLFQGMFAGLMTFYGLLAGGISIGGVTLSAVVTTVLLILIAAFVFKLIRSL